MKTTLALDLNHRSDGAREFLHWLSGARDRALNVHAVHVVPEQALAKDGPFSTRPAADLIQTARNQLVDRLQAHQALALTGDPAVCTGPTIETSLERECANHDSELLVIGRAAGVSERSIVRLGQVARRLLRRLTLPTAVVPRDLKAQEIGPGPVVVALGCHGHDVASSAWARRFAESIGRPVVFTHVASPPETWTYGYIESGAERSVGEYFLKLGRRSATEWLEKLGSMDHELVVEQGPTCEGVVAVAQRLHACAIVCGSRKLSAIERVFSTSVGSELAASSPVPVIIVPG